MDPDPRIRTTDPDPAFFVSTDTLLFCLLMDPDPCNNDGSGSTTLVSSVPPKPPYNNVGTVRTRVAGPNPHLVLEAGSGS
jgi:hypothetical protein